MHTLNRTQPLLQALPAARMAASDWDALFTAVVSRLRATVATPAGRDAAAHAAVDPVQTTVLECVEALEQLRTLLPQEIERMAQLAQRVEDGDAAIALLRTELACSMAQGQQSHHRALHDDLTALPNRHFFRERLSRALTPPASAHTPPAVLYLDLDSFQDINERHGNEVGDELLRIVAMRLSRVMRNEDVVRRLGGDEFACLLAEPAGREQLSHVACKLFDAVSAPLKISGLQLTVRPSIGIAISPGDGATAGALLKSADIAMTHAKRIQAGYAFFDSCDTK